MREETKPEVKRVCPLDYNQLTVGEVYETAHGNVYLATVGGNVIALESGLAFSHGIISQWQFRHLPNATFSRGE